jgi:hypothetical protein
LEEHDPVTADAVQTFGWRELCHYDYKDENTVRAQFRETFKGTQKRSVQREMQNRLPGGAEVRSIGTIVREVIGDGGDRRG